MLLDPIPLEYEPSQSSISSMRLHTNARSTRGTRGTPVSISNDFKNIRCSEIFPTSESQSGSFVLQIPIP